MFLKRIVRKETRDTLWLGFPVLRRIAIPRIRYCGCFTNHNDCLFVYYFFYKVGSFDVGHDGCRFVHHSGASHLLVRVGLQEHGKVPNLYFF
jgi:hypothetical protein